MTEHEGGQTREAATEAGGEQAHHDGASHALGGLHANPLVAGGMYKRAMSRRLARRVATEGTGAAAAATGGAATAGGATGGEASGAAGGGAAEVTGAQPASHGGGAGGASPERALELGMTGHEAPLPHLQTLRKRFPAGLEHVRCYFGPQAKEASRQMGAEAFAVGNVIVFGVESPSLDLVAHELAHVVQQGGLRPGNGIASAPSGLEVTAPGGAEEHEADQQAAAISGGGDHADPKAARIDDGGGKGDQKQAAEQQLAADSPPVLARFLATNAAGVWLVGDPSHYRATVLNHLPLGTRVVVTDTGAGQPFNRTDPATQWHRVRVTTGPDMGAEGWVMQTLLGNQPETTEVTPAEASRLFTELAGAHFADAHGGQSPIPFHFPIDGCYDRAYLMANLLTEKGYASEKVFALSRTSLGLPGLTVPTPYAQDSPTGSTPAVQWWYHVAPIIHVRDAQGHVTEMVIDPSMAAGPITIGQWTGMMSSGTFDRQTVGDMQALMLATGGIQQAAVGRNLVYTTDRNAYGPGDLGPHSRSAADAEHASSLPTITDYARLSTVHELAAAIRNRLHTPPVRADDLMAIVQRAPATARHGLWSEFPTLRQDVTTAVGNATDMTRIDHALAAP